MPTSTTNYGWSKPIVGADDDLWGGFINTDLDGIDATVKTVSNTAIGDNRIINGDMRIDQRNAGASGTATGTYTIDRWYFGANQASKFTWSRATSNPGNTGGFAYYLSFGSQSAYASLTGDVFNIRQPIEADFIIDFAFGTPNAQPVTLSFTVQSSLTGTFSGVLANAASGPTRCYPFTFSIPAANTWTKIVVTIPGDTGGTWTLSGNGVGACLFFDLGSGATFRGPAGAWASANYTGVTGSVSVVGTNGATFFLTGVKLELGSVATPYNRQSLVQSLADCQRYYQATAYILVGGYNGAGGNVFETLGLPVTMRTSPTVAFANPAPSYSNASALAVNTAIAASVTAQVTITAVGAGMAFGGMTCSAEL